MHEASVSSDQRRVTPFRSLVIAWLVIFVLLAPGADLEIYLQRTAVEDFFLTHQDSWGFAICFATTLALALAPAAWLRRLAPPPGRPIVWVWGLALAALVIGAAGVWLVFDNYTLSLDEALANFDAKIFAHGQLMAPTDPAWRPYIDALQPLYILPVPGGVAWVSGYLPVNAAMRALFSRAGAEWLVNPLLSAVSVLAVYAVGRRLWPDRPRIGLAAAVMTGVSAQLLVTAMTAYAMPAHLAFNLAWMWLFLRGGRLGHAGALIVGFFATGIHQILFHPLFVAPFVLQLWLDRRWTLALLYALAYAAIGVFWIEYWQLAADVSGYGSQTAAALGGDWFAERVTDVLDAIQWRNLTEMSQSLVRFVTWQSPLLAPLLAMGAWAALRAGGHLRAMLLGIVLTLTAMTLLVPTQVNGWGYRYMHGLLGSAALIAAWTWDRLTSSAPAALARAAGAGLAISCAVSLLVLTPLRAWQAWSYCHPYAVTAAALARLNTDVVVVDHGERGVGFDPNTLVRNDPYLANRPKLMSLFFISPEQLRSLCATHSVILFDGHDAQRLGIGVVNVVAEPRIASLRRLMARLNCGRPMPR